jgi:hypothetical protein
VPDCGGHQICCLAHFTVLVASELNTSLFFLIWKTEIGFCTCVLHHFYL